MGANEERIKNMRKKDLTQKNQKTRPKDNSRSIANRKKWDLAENKTNNLNNIFNNFEINNNNNNNINNANGNETSVGANASRSKSRKKQDIKKPIAAHIDYKAISKLILNNNTTATSNINFNHRSNHNYELNSQNNYSNNSNHVNFNSRNNINNNNSSTKHINSKDSITNLEEMLNDIHTVNRNITNLNKFNLNSESPINKRRRNWGEPKYNIVFPDLSTSIEQNLGGIGIVSSKNKKRNITNYSNHVISNNNLNSSFNKITENEIDGYNSVLGVEYNNLNSSIAGVSKERDVYLGKAKHSNASNNSNNNSINYVNSCSNNVNNLNNKNQILINLTYEKNSGNSTCYNNKTPNLNNNIDYSNNSNNSSNNLKLNLNQNQNSNINIKNDKNISNNTNTNNNNNNNNRENSTSTTNFKNSGSSLILSNLNQSSNNAFNYNKNTFSSTSNQNLNSNPDIINNTNNNINNNNYKKQASKNLNLQSVKKSLNSISNLNSNKPITNEILYESANSAIITNRYWEAGGANTNRKNYNLNSSSEHGKNDEVMLVLENLNNSEIMNISNSGFNNNVINNQNNLAGNMQNNYKYVNSKANPETEVIVKKNNIANNNSNNNNKKYSNIVLNLNNSNTSSLNTRKFISLNSHSQMEKDRKLEELNSSSNNKSKIIPVAHNTNNNNLNSKIKLNSISNSNNNQNLINLSANNNNNTSERPFSSIVNLSKLKAEKLKISDLAGVSGISPKNNFPSIQFIYKSPQNINLKSGQRPLSHIQKSKSTLISKTSTNYINSNIFSNNNSNTNVVNQMLSNPFEISHHAYNFKNSNTYSTLDRFSSREKQTNFFNNNNTKNNVSNKTYNGNNNNNNTNIYNNNDIENGNNILDDNLNQLITKDISNTQFNFSRKKNQYPTISKVQKLSGNNLRSNYNNNNHNINNLNSVLNNLIYSRNPSTNPRIKSSNGNTSNIIESDIILSSSNYKEPNNYNSRKSENSSSNNNFDYNNTNKDNNNNNLISNSNSANKLNNDIENKTDLLQHLEKLDEKKIKKVFKYIEKLSENNFDTSEISMLESRNFLENPGKNLEKLNINYIKTDSINFGNININMNNNHNSNSNNVNNNTFVTNTTGTGINQVNSVVSKVRGMPNVRKESGLNQAANMVKNKILSMNNSISAGGVNANYISATTQWPKPSFSSSMKERNNKKYQTVDDQAAYGTNDKEDIVTNMNHDAKKYSAIKSRYIYLYLKF